MWRDLGVQKRGDKEWYCKMLCCCGIRLRVLWIVFVFVIRYFWGRYRLSLLA
ncbi:hypothetical protein B9Z19DRAFT_394043 [Tuber borchii]|uniref:Transmembrane protein n=1 Tax=Tuber borchii TaxID=42251 RepID=A0A2T6ZHC2_TUBBO|nr:hypothetical protein B9Z19DRAFT_394043 [Tuber borchii]